MITVVSGLPRSGTSLMMQMLNEGGMEPYTDNMRRADESNPRGYYECEKVKSLHLDNSWLEEAQESAVKVVAQWLPHLPEENEYAVLFMERDIEEVLRSQEQLLERAGKLYSAGDTEHMASSYIRLTDELKAWMSQKENMRVMEVSFHEVISDPALSAAVVNDFLNAELDEESMAAAVEATLYRNRRSE